MQQWNQVFPFISKMPLKHISWRQKSRWLLTRRVEQQLWLVIVTQIQCDAASLWEELKTLWFHRLKPFSRVKTRHVIKLRKLHSSPSTTKQLHTHTQTHRQVCVLPGAAWFMLSSLVIRTSRTWTRGSRPDSDLKQKQKTQSDFNITCVQRRRKEVKSVLFNYFMIVSVSM